MSYNVDLTGYNLEALEKGLELLGKSVSEYTSAEIGIMLTHALGYVDFTDKSIVEEMLEVLK